MVMQLVREYWFRLLCLAAAVFVGLYWANAHRYVMVPDGSAVLDTRTGLVLEAKLK